MFVCPFSTKEENLSLPCHAQGMKMGESCWLQLTAVRAMQWPAGKQEMSGTYTVTSLSFHWNICQIFRNSVLLTSSLFLNIAPARLIWYKIYFDFVITMAWWYLELEKWCRDLMLSPPDLSQCPLLFGSLIKMSSNHHFLIPVFFCSRFPLTFQSIVIWA